MNSGWKRKTYETSLTRTYLPTAPASATWKHQGEEAAQSPVYPADDEMGRLLDLESAAEPVPAWAKDVAAQIARLSPCGWAMGHGIEAVCQNIGAADAKAARLVSGEHAGPHRLALMSDFAVCLDGWLRGLSPETVAARTSEASLGWRDWEFIARRLAEALGTAEAGKALLVHRLVARLRLWIRAMGTDRPAETPRRPRAAQKPDEHVEPDLDAQIEEMDEKLRAAIPNADRWIDLIDAPWPRAPRMFHYLERMLAAVGEVDRDPHVSPDELLDVESDPTSPGHPPFRSADRICQTVLRVLEDYLDDRFPHSVDPKAALDEEWAGRLTDRLGEPTKVGTWLAALLHKRITLLDECRKHLRCQPNTQQVV